MTRLRRHDYYVPRTVLPLLVGQRIYRVSLRKRRTLYTRAMNVLAASPEEAGRKALETYPGHTVHRIIEG
jgi:hypothetical protein